MHSLFQATKKMLSY